MLPRLITAVTASLFATAAVAYPEPEPCYGACYVRDPALVKRESDGSYWKFTTGDMIGIYKAPTLWGPWVFEGSVLPEGSIMDPGNENLWAPDLIEVDGTWVLFYALSALGNQNSSIGYATSDTLENGTWVDHGSTGLSSTTESEYNCIDPAIIKADGNYFMTFGSYWDDIFQVKFSKDGRTIDGTPYQVAYNASGDHDIEGSFVYEHDGYYYLFFSQGDSEDYDTDFPTVSEAYKVYVCRSRDYAGGYVDQDGVSCLESGGTLVLESHGEIWGPGGQGVLNDNELGDILYYFYINTSYGLTNDDDQFGWNVINWVDGWPTL